ncbi:MULTISPECIES: hypothetical protein [Sphingobium]|uniref:Uncharacterized protein n=1 Tax=Sphingobium cupriresistens TaxID=1132417 RepID=A0A8G2DWQ8_9SPHN|nr:MULTISPECIES: hypothetical protein [Sphingobium]MBJ7377366.1 hypothetical protein [Sphingobium sp.]MBJ7445654.1 hypothetical protein [Sphingobium sp.]RYM07921.1 hypothetical protein EWH12_17925 [Sphingobium cupriresistens]WCP14920.1 hypothetical protein sphantq_03370 [Sphingobium sp. AntQ-1]
MKATLRSTFMRLTLMAAAIGLLLRAILFDRADLPYAIGIMAAALAYEALFHVASNAIRHNYDIQAAPSA